MKTRTIIIVVAALIILSVLPLVSLKISGMVTFDASPTSIMNTLLIVLSIAIITAFVAMMIKENRVQ